MDALAAGAGNAIALIGFIIFIVCGLTGGFLYGFIFRSTNLLIIFLLAVATELVSLLFSLNLFSGGIILWAMVTGWIMIGVYLGTEIGIFSRYLVIKIAKLLNPSAFPPEESQKELSLHAYKLVRNNPVGWVIFIFIIASLTAVSNVNVRKKTTLLNSASPTPAPRSVQTLPTEAQAQQGETQWLRAYADKTYEYFIQYPSHYYLFTENVQKKIESGLDGYLCLNNKKSQQYCAIEIYIYKNNQFLSLEDWVKKNEIPLNSYSGPLSAVASDWNGMESMTSRNETEQVYYVARKGYVYRLHSSIDQEDVLALNSFRFFNTNQADWKIFTDRTDILTLKYPPYLFESKSIGQQSTRTSIGEISSSSPYNLGTDREDEILIELFIVSRPKTETLDEYIEKNILTYHKEDTAGTGLPQPTIKIIPEVTTTFSIDGKKAIAYEGLAYMSVPHIEIFIPLNDDSFIQAIAYEGTAAQEVRNIQQYKINRDLIYSIVSSIRFK